MSCNKYKNRNYKSSLQFFNNVSQAILATNTNLNPVVLDLGDVVTDTGCAFSFTSRSVQVEASGLYRFSVELDTTGGTNGDVTVAMTLNGAVIPETIKTFAIGATGVSRYVTLETIRLLRTCCNNSEYNIGVIAYSDGTAVGAINSVSGNALKLA